MIEPMRYRDMVTPAAITEPVYALRLRRATG